MGESSVGDWQQRHGGGLSPEAVAWNDMLKATTDNDDAAYQEALARLNSFGPDKE